MIRRLSSLITFAAALGFVAVASAQAPGMGMGMAAGGAPTAMDTRFMDIVPGIGEQLPDISIVDDHGNPVNMRDITTTGRYTVLTLGCLT